MPSTDRFQGHYRKLSSPLTSAAEITPSDTADLGAVSRALFIGAGGDLRVSMADGQTVTFGGLAGGWHPIRVRRIHATGTTATAIVACW